MIQNIDIHPLTPTEIVYFVFHNNVLVHVGESKGITRAFTSVSTIVRALSGPVTATFVECSSLVRSCFALPDQPPRDCKPRQNLERLLQAAFVTRYATMPQEDRIRGGKTGQAAATGAYIKSVDIVRAAFDLLDKVIPPTPLARAWPTLPQNVADSIGPAVSATKPGTKRRYLAFWVELGPAGPTCHIGHVPDNNGTPTYAAATGALVWSAAVSPTPTPVE